MNTAEKRDNINEGHGGNDYYQFGLDYFGPFLLGFIRWLCRKLEQNNIHKVYFFARDGYMMEKAFNLIMHEEIHAEYVYFSRKSIRQSLLYQCKCYEESLQYISAETSITLGGILEYYGFDEEERCAIATSKRLDLKQDYNAKTLKDDKMLEKLYIGLQSEINKKSKKQDALLLRYLHQIAMVGRVAIVDIGWKGSMQYYLESFISAHNLAIEIEGYYVGIKPQKPLSGKTYGFLFDADHEKLRKKVLCFAGISERLFQSLEGSTYGYQEADDEVKPILNTYEYADDAILKNHIQEIHRGALSYISQNQNTVRENHVLAEKLMRFGVRPTLKELSLFAPFYNTDGTREYYVSQKPLYKYSFKELRHAISNSSWKNGFFKSIFKIPFPYYEVYRLLKK